ncbi:MAG TPA: zinc ABC transporter substrate-binding protein [Jatrophihabitans sp.]|nr:zinc ABC transporter substrate-binding protein [Jatrophihabitans sp.]
MVRRPGVVSVAVLLAAVGVATGCSTSSVAANPGSSTGSGGSNTVVDVAASINAWGSILSQLGGSHVHETSIITNPDTDPHDYEPTPSDGTTIARSRLFVQNGIGYDSWAAKSLAASPDSSRSVINVGDLVHIPAGGNPHRWYSPTDVNTVADAITADLKKLDPADASYFDGQRQAFATSALATYNGLIKTIQTKYAGTPVGASESIFAPLAQALKLDLITPPTFLKAISEGTDPSPSDLSTINAQISGKKIKVYVFNSQNATPDVAAQVKAAKAAGIPVSTVTETLSPATASFQQWQSAQLQALANALHKATGK